MSSSLQLPSGVLTFLEATVALVDFLEGRIVNRVANRVADTLEERGLVSASTTPLPETENVMTIEELHVYLKLSPLPPNTPNTTLRKRIRDDHLPEGASVSVFRDGKDKEDKGLMPSRRWSKAAVDAWLEKKMALAQVALEQQQEERTSSLLPALPPERARKRSPRKRKGKG